MELQQKRGRGRARGRARGPETGGPAQKPGPQAAPAQAAPAATGAWGPRRQQYQSAPQPVHSGRASDRGTGEAKAPGKASAISGATSGCGEPGLQAGRGAIRGRRILSENIPRTRPEHLITKQGTHGNVVKLSANYFKLLQRTDWCLYQYRVDFSPEEDRTPIRKRLLRIGIRAILPGYIFDGTVFYSSRRLDHEPYEVVVPSAEEGGEPVRITLRLVGDVTLGDYHYIQVFNIILRKCMDFLDLQLVGRNFYDASARTSIPNHKIELWPGYITSIRQHEESILLCCEVTHKVMRMDTVLQLLIECLEEDRDGYKALFQGRIISSIVLTDYNNRTYRIDDVDWSATPSSTFTKADGTTISYIQYFRERYNLNIRDLKQPMLVSRAKPRELRAGMSETVYLVPELCRMTGLTDAQKNNFQLMRALADHTRVDPHRRIDKLIKFSRRLSDKKQIVDELKQWDLQLANTLIEFSGRVLPPERMSGGNSQTYSGGEQVDWTRELRSAPMLVNSTCNIWVVLTPSRCRSSSDSFVQMLQRAAGGMRWNLPQPRVIEMRDDRPGTYMDHLDSAITQYNPSVILCVASNIKSDRYSAIKKKCCVDRAVPTQVIVAKNLDSKGAMSIATKVAVQMNCKLGGAPWSISIPVSNMMVVGYDVCHDPFNKTKSYGAMVASLDRGLTRYFSCVTAHTRGEEISNDFALNLIKACKKYKEINGVYPDKILIYRDGVGDGQIPYVFEHEVSNIKKILRDNLYGANGVKLCFIIVSKRINTRIFADGKNPVPGTVVDSCITLPERYDFFLVSQCVRQGSVSPTSYNIIEDNMGLSADHLQRLTYKLTHMYYNWSGTVRVPAPCQYAHKLAFLVAQSLHRDPNPELETLLYYL